MRRIGDLANALCNVGQHREALEFAENALTIAEQCVDPNSAAVGHGQSAKILRDMGRFSEADARYDLKLPLPAVPWTMSWRKASSNQGILADDRTPSSDRATPRLPPTRTAAISGCDEGRPALQTYNFLA